VHCAEVVLEQASKKKPVFIASTSEAHGKSHDIPYHEDGDLTPWLHAPGRWSYACSSVHGDGTERRCFCHVGDVVRAIADLMHREDVYGEVLVGADEEITILELARSGGAGMGADEVARGDPRRRDRRPATPRAGESLQIDRRVCANVRAAAASSL
jgi:dTDP-D-glucose 4,6-dehydratase